MKKTNKNIRNRSFAVRSNQMLVYTLAASLLLSGSQGAFAAVPPPAPGGTIYSTNLSAQVEATDGETTWIVKWSEGAAMPADMAAETELIGEMELTPNASVVRPKPGVQADEWRSRWERHSSVVYMTLNQSVHTSAKPDDLLYPFQEYLGPIGAEAAWDTTAAGDLAPVTVAIIDTGVDFDHPELKGVFTEGVNLINPEKSPQDDNGHGTNVAGIIGALRNGAGIAGIADNVRLMPIKALDRSGKGKEAQLGEGIRYAIEQGAKVVVLSVGLLKDDPFIREAVEYAESRDCVLVAATGNDEGRYVNYPAAYSTVLAVGGVSLSGKPEARSNYGPEVDLVAPWNVYTTRLGGRYEYKDGTSMAAPQVAAAAALVRGKHPGLKAFEVRSLLRQTAQDTGDPGWDERTGYGLLRLDRALTEPLLRDPAEPNNNMQSAAPFPLGTFISGEWMPGDEDWFWFDASEAGVLELKLHGVSVEEKLAITLMNGEGHGQQGPHLIWAEKPLLTLNVPKGRSYVRVMGGNRHLLYRLASRLVPPPDEFESNDRVYMAYTLPDRSQTLTGTFHNDNDEDWFLFDATRPGMLKLQVTPSSRRMDPVLTYVEPGQPPKEIDESGLGKGESTSSLEVMPGAYYIGVRNYDAAAPLGTYKLQIDFVPAATDPYEPNDKSFQATVLTSGEEYAGVISQNSDADWFTMQSDGDSLLELSLAGGGTDQTYTLTVFDSGVGEVASYSGKGGGELQWTARVQEPGAYYVRVTANRKNVFRPYRLKVDRVPLVEGFRDLNDHWAQPQIVSIVRSGWMSGYGTYEFRPDRVITRAEVAASIARALKLSGEGVNEFTDVPADHWAAKAIAQLVERGWLGGDADGKFSPDRAITRAEMAVLAGRILQVPVKNIGPASSPFKDVPIGHWALPMLRQLHAGGWIDGYEDGTFKPGGTATRAEWVAMLTSMLKRG